MSEDTRKLDLMIDLEAFGRGPTGAIQQIGWATFDPLGEGIHTSGNIYVNVQDAIDRGCTITYSCIRWWLAQEQGVRGQARIPGLELPDALNALNMVYADYEIEHTWAKPITYDLAMLIYAYGVTHMPVPWCYRKFRDLATLMRVMNHRPKVAIDGIAHVAETDAVKQAKQTQRILRYIDRLKEPRRQTSQKRHPKA